MGASPLLFVVVAQVAAPAGEPPLAPEPPPTTTTTNPPPEAPADSPTPTVAPAAPVAPIADVVMRKTTSLCPEGMVLCWQNDVAAVWPKLRIRPGFEYVEADPEILYIGENDGFFLDSARLGAEGNIADVVRFRAAVDVARLVAGVGPNQPVTPIFAAPNDAWVAWTPSQWFMMRAGQQNVPADLEGDDVDAVIPFTRRSVAAAGVRAGHGNAVPGLSPGRQIGIVLGSGSDLRVGEFPIEYRVGVTNGNGANLLGNDNKWPAGYLRLGGGFAELVRIGVGGRFNPRTTGSLPNLYTETDAVGFADVTVTAFGAEVVLAGQLRQTSLITLVPDPNNPAGQEGAAGVTTWVAYSFALGSLIGAPLDVKPALRFSFYDPSSAFETDQLAETTIGVRLDGDGSVVPLSLLVDYTVLTEVGGAVTRDLANNRLTALFQLEL